MNQKVPQKLNRFNFFQVIAGSRWLSQTSNDLCFHIKFEGAGDRSQAVAGSITVIWKPGLRNFSISNIVMTASNRALKPVPFIAVKPHELCAFYETSVGWRGFR